DLVEDREAVVEEIVQDVVEQVARALAEELVSQCLVLLAAPEEAGHRQQLDVLVVDGEMEDREEVALIRVLVDLGALALREHVLEVERVPAEPLLESCRFLHRRGIEVDPGQAVGGELLNTWLCACEDFPVAGAGPRSLDARKAWHWY